MSDRYSSLCFSGERGRGGKHYITFVAHVTLAQMRDGINAMRRSYTRANYVKGFLLDLTIWQLFPFLLVTALFWPIRGPDGKISYLAKGDLRAIGYILPGTRISI